jgi:hypothetical protein
MTVVETIRFLRDIDGVLAEGERAELVTFLGSNPEAGDIIAETGGVRKLRWARAGMGKRGGARVIYYFHNERMPIFLLAAYAKTKLQISPGPSAMSSNNSSRACSRDIRT